MQGSEFDEAEFFRAIAGSGARALLIGRRALVALGIPVLTADYDFWIHIDDIAAFNAAVEPQGLFRHPDTGRGAGKGSLRPRERRTGRRAGRPHRADGRRREGGIRRSLDAPPWLEVAAGVTIAVPALDDLILTKRFGGRPKDLEDIRLLEALRKEQP